MRVEMDVGAMVERWLSHRDDELAGRRDRATVFKGRRWMAMMAGDGGVRVEMDGVRMEMDSM
nr:hypothetical protein [Oryza sativa Japonica Group]